MLDNNDFLSYDSEYENTICKYYSVEQFNENIHNFKNNFNIYHNNLNGLETKFDNFHQFISENNLFDVIAITETSQKKSNNGFLSNVEIEGYNSYAIASNTSKGGSLLYINNKYKIGQVTCPKSRERRQIR